MIKITVSKTILKIGYYLYIEACHLCFLFINLKTTAVYNLQLIMELLHTEYVSYTKIFICI